MNSLQLTGQVDNHIAYLGKDTSSIGIHNDMTADWLAMQAAAEKDNISLTIASGFRNFDRQLSIWNRKFTGELVINDSDNKPVDISGLSELDIVHAILLYSALPGASRHHWGCDIDVYDKHALGDNTLQLSQWEYSVQGYFSHLSQWLSTNATSYGFYFPYDKYRNGIAVEPWHLSYAPLSQQFEPLLSVDILKELIATKNIQGKATLIAHLPQIIEQYITNVGKPQ